MSTVTTTPHEHVHHHRVSRAIAAASVATAAVIGGAVALGGVFSSDDSTTTRVTPTPAQAADSMKYRHYYSGMDIGLRPFQPNVSGGRPQPQP